MLTLELTTEEARFLRDMLRRHLAEIEDELVHTDTRNLQRELSKDFDRLQALLRRIDLSIDTPAP